MEKGRTKPTHVILSGKPLHKINYTLYKFKGKKKKIESPDFHNVNLNWSAFKKL